MAYMYQSPVFREACLLHVVRDGKRYSRYPMHLSKDLKRLDFCAKRANDIANMFRCLPNALTGRQESYTGTTVSGWNGWTATDLKAVASSDLIEIVAIIEYWDLWQVLPELLQRWGYETLIPMIEG